MYSPTKFNDPIAPCAPPDPSDPLRANKSHFSVSMSGESPPTVMSSVAMYDDPPKETISPFLYVFVVDHVPLYMIGESAP